MPKKKRASSSKKAARSAPKPATPITQEAVDRLEKLAETLADASKEAAAVADLARNELGDEFAKDLLESGEWKRGE